jgi:hypothetical protein
MNLRNFLLNKVVVVGHILISSIVIGQTLPPDVSMPSPASSGLNTTNSTSINYDPGNSITAGASSNSTNAGGSTINSVPGTDNSTDASSARTSTGNSTDTSSSSTSAGNSSAVVIPTSSILGGKMQAKGKLYFGDVFDQNTMKNENVTKLLRSQFNAITPEYSACWNFLENEKGKYTYETLDEIVKFAQGNNMYVRGHTLLWYEGIPKWVNNITDKDVMRATIEEHVTNTVTRYKGKIFAWVRSSFETFIHYI